MKKFYFKYKVIIIVVVYLLFVILTICFLGVPLIREIKKQSSRIQEQLLDQQIKQNRLSQLPQMEKELTNYQNKKDSLNVMFDPNNEIKFIEDLEKIADKTGNTIKLKIGVPVKVNKIVKSKKSKIGEGIEEGITYKKYFPVQINLQGDYNGLVNFVYQLENAKLYLNIISLDIKKQEVIQDKIQSNKATNLNGVFSVNVVTEDNKLIKEKPKEILSSNIKIIVYLRE